jgi:hypothetical protein
MGTSPTLHSLGTILVLALALAVSLPAAPAAAEDDAAPKMNVSFPGDYVRRVENDQTVLVLGYRTANLSVGEKWMLLEVAMTVKPGHDMTLTRNDFTLETPDGATVQLASQHDFNANPGVLRALDQRASIQRDSLNYLPTRASRPCRIGFFTDLATPQRGMSWDQFEVNPEMACVGRLYFEVPDEIQYGRYFLHVNLTDGEIAAPMTIMTKEELKKVKAEVKAYQKEQKQKAKEEKKANGGA